MIIDDSAAADLAPLSASEILAVLVAAQNAWMEADTDKLRAIHAELVAQVFPRMPPVLPSGLPPLTVDEARKLMSVLRELRGEQRVAKRRRGEGPRARRSKSDPHPVGWGHGRT